jgi:hypothetical protein
MGRRRIPLFGSALDRRARIELKGGEVGHIVLRDDDAFSLIEDDGDTCTIGAPLVEAVPQIAE